MKRKKKKVRKKKEKKEEEADGGYDVFFIMAQVQLQRGRSTQRQTSQAAESVWPDQ